MFALIFSISLILQNCHHSHFKSESFGDFIQQIFFIRKFHPQNLFELEFEKFTICDLCCVFFLFRKFMRSSDSVILMDFLSLLLSVKTVSTAYFVKFQAYLNYSFCFPGVKSMSFPEKLGFLENFFVFP